jgi:hypothetical protein
LLRINAIPLLQSLSQKYSCFHPTQISGLSLAIPSQTRGVSRFVTDVGRGAVDADALLTNSA